LKPGARADTLRAAWHYYRDNYPPGHPRRERAARAYSLIGHHRDRIEYDYERGFIRRVTRQVQRAGRWTSAHLVVTGLWGLAIGLLVAALLVSR
jgi:hypothetical protein